MKRVIALVGTALVVLASPAVHAEEYKGAAKTFLFNPELEVCVKDTTQYKKAGPYTIGFSNAGLGDSWRVVMQHSIQRAAAENKASIKHLLITDAGHDDAKQIADIQDLISRGVDLLIVSANTQKALDAVVTRAMKKGIPVVMVDRNIASDNYVTFVTASDAQMGRLWAQWIVERLNGTGNVIILAGQAGSSPSENRIKSARQVFAMYPGIKILDTVYSDWSPVKGKQVMQAMINKYGKSINAVWAAHGNPVAGSIEAFIEAGFKDGEIPMHTTADVNGPLQLALKHKIPMLEIGYPPAMGGVAVTAALQILKGVPVPCNYAINAQIATTDGKGTASIRPDLAFKDMVVPNGPSNLIITGGMGKDYDPKTYKVDYPK